MMSRKSVVTNGGREIVVNKKKSAEGENISIHSDNKDVATGHKHSIASIDDRNQGSIGNPQTVGNDTTLIHIDGQDKRPSVRVRSRQRVTRANLEKIRANS